MRFKYLFFRSVFCFLILLQCSGNGYAYSLSVDCVLNAQKTYFFALIDGNDCNRCTMLVNALKDEHKAEIDYIFYQNIPEFGREDLLKQLGFPKELKSLNDYDCIGKWTRTLELQPGDRSGVVKYDPQSDNFEFVSFKRLLDTDVQQKFFALASDKKEIKRIELDYKRYFSFATSLTKFGENFVVSTNASNGLLVFDTAGKLKTEIDIDTAVWRNLYQLFHAEILTDSSRSLNSDSISLSLYNNYLKSMGQQLWTFQSSFIADSLLVCVVNVYFTVNTIKGNIRHDGAEFLLMYDDKFSLKDYYLVPRGALSNTYNAGAFNGIGFQEGKFRMFLYPIDSFKLKEVNPISIAYTTSEGHILKPLKDSTPVLNRSTILTYNKSAELFSLKHRYSARQYIYLETLPLILHTDGRVFSIQAKDTLRGYLNFYSVERPFGLESVLFYNDSLRLTKLRKTNKGTFKVSEEFLLNGLPKDEAIQTVFISQGTCYILTLNEKTGLVINAFSLE